MSTFPFFILIISQLFIYSIRGVEILNHIRGIGTGIRDTERNENTLLMTLEKMKNNPSEIIYDKLWKDLSDTLIDDGCELSFTGRSGSDIVITFHCQFLNNTRKTGIKERAKFPPLLETSNLLKERGIIVKHREYLQKFQRPSSFYYHGTYESQDRSLQDYFRFINAPNEEREKLELLVKRRKLYPDIHGEFVEAMAPWGLDRIDTRYGALDNLYNYNLLGDTIDIYVVDTGINVNHSEFDGGRAIHLVNTAGDGIDTDCNGHGTHVASIAGGHNFGVAKGVTLFAVKALDCSGSGDTFTIVTAMMAIIEHKNTRPGRRAVASMSLGGDYSNAINSAVLSLITENVVTVVAAGNEHSDACSYSPSSLGQNSPVIVVGASDAQDVKPHYSNYGRCVVISAPGDGITGADFSSNSGSIVHSGTSMATPHASGVAAIILQQDLSLTPLQVRQAMISWATPNIVTQTSSLGGGKHLLFSLITLSEDPPANLNNPSPPTGGSGGGNSIPSSANNIKINTTLIGITLIFLAIIL